MQRLTEEHSYAKTIRALRHHAIRLQSHPETRPLAEECVVARRNLQNKGDVYEEAREARVAKTSQIVYLDGEVDAEMMNLSRGVLAETKGNRDAPHYRQLFPIAPSTAMASTNSEAQQRFVRTVIQRLREEAEYEALCHHADTLEKLQEELDTAEQERNDLYIKESKAGTDLRIFLDKVQRDYNLSYPRLQLLFPDKSRFVESFFLRLRTPTSPKTTDED